MTNSTNIETLSAEEANRLMCADYLRCIAKMIENGAIGAFDFVWKVEVGKLSPKPEGRVVMDANFLTGPLELEVMAKMREALKKEKAQIQVVDLTNEIKDPDQEESEYDSTGDLLAEIRAKRQEYFVAYQKAPTTLHVTPAFYEEYVDRTGLTSYDGIPLVATLDPATGYTYLFT